MYILFRILLSLVLNFFAFRNISLFVWMFASTTLTGRSLPSERKPRRRTSMIPVRGLSGTARSSTIMLLSISVSAATFSLLSHFVPSSVVFCSGNPYIIKFIFLFSISFVSSRTSFTCRLAVVLHSSLISEISDLT